MNLPNIKGAFNTISFVVRKHAPEILLGAGTVGVIAGSVLACKATLKLESIIDDTKDMVECAHDIHDGKVKIKEGEVYSDADLRTDIMKAYGVCAGKILRIYAPAVILGGLSIASFFASHNIMKRRYLEVGAALSAISTQFKGYRKRVADEFGEEKERQLYSGTTTKKIKEKVTDPETGKTKTVTKEVETPLDETPLDETIRVVFCQETSPEWTNDPEYCWCFLKNTQRFCNERLKAEGRIMLNDIRDELGLPKTKAGYRYGWKYEKNNPDGDNMIDFGIRELTVSSDNSDEVNEIIKDNKYSKIYELDFNCDGDVWEDWDRQLNK